MRKHEGREIDAFELWCWTLESRVPKAALSYFGHVVRAGGMEDDVMLGRMNGARRRGRPRQR